MRCLRHHLSLDRHLIVRRHVRQRRDGVSGRKGETGGKVIFSLLISCTWGAVTAARILVAVVIVIEVGEWTRFVLFFLVLLAVLAAELECNNPRTHTYENAMIA